ncbi:MAG: flagellar biosynthesis protein FlhB [Desulfocapsaceae bacterium]|nr:flagellar biosynthesis protein FlhB [Desulfocapsaceae bacterium]
MAEETPTGGERTEAATSKRRDDFRKKGQVAQSKEVHTAALLSSQLLFWIFYMPIFWRGVNTLIIEVWKSSSEFTLTPVSTINLTVHLFQQMGLLLAPLFTLVLIIGFFSSFFQIGWLFTTTPLIPDFTRFDLIKGIGRFFSKRSLLEVVKSLVKVSVIGWIAFKTVIGKFSEALILVDTSPMTIVGFIGRTAIVILAKICALLIFLAMLDYLFVRWEMEEKMKMTKQELKEEFKETEGDPLVKRQIRTIQQQMARRRMMADVPKADVVITNPTHLSVAIQYNAKQMEAPIIIAKGADHIAMKIREIAREHKIPLVENPPVARLLHKLELGTTIPEEMFKAVAEILAYVYSLKGKTL